MVLIILPLSLPPITIMKSYLNHKIYHSQYGDAEVDGEDYSVSRYCLEKSEDVYDGWKLMTCYQDYYIQNGFHILSMNELIP